MIRVEAQLHGYSHGHELLAASKELAKSDQAVVDRLSDVAGPLRSGETFQPYLSTYPLPSGEWTVLARTWPDDTVRRPGCVRTLSLLIPADDWAQSASLLPFLALLAMPVLPSVAKGHSLPRPQATPLPPTPQFSASELLEALFLEENRPVALFDAPDPELLAVRLLSAMWPSMRRHFALSTLALSPRRVEGRDFNLVFAPKSARQKFADWSGRRVDGSAKSPARHRWTGSIAERVFAAPFPRLLEEADLQSGGFEEGSTGGLLRISLLWDELRERLEETPSAALGMLDIARTRPSLSQAAQHTLREAVTEAARRAVHQLPAADAWDLLGAMARKLRGTTLDDEVESLQSAVRALASIDPVGALRLLASDASAEGLSSLIAPIATGVAKGLDRVPAGVVAAVPARTIVQLLLSAPPLAQALATPPQFQEVLKGIADQLESYGASASNVHERSAYCGFRNALLPYLTEDFQAPLASRFVKTLDVDQLVRVVQGLVDANDFSSQAFAEPIVYRARALGATHEVRKQVLQVANPVRRRDLIRSSLDASADDIEWVLNGDLDSETSDSMLVELLLSADDGQFRGLLDRPNLRNEILQRVPATETSVLLRILASGALPLDAHVRTAVKGLQGSSQQAGVELAFKALERCLRGRFPGNEVATIVEFFSAVALVLSPTWAISHGIDGSLGSDLINRNLQAFDRCEPSVRSKFVSSIDVLASAFEGRWSLDLDREGAEACANLFWSAAQEGAPNLVSACGRLVPKLLRSKGWPVSSIIPATFPLVYRELAAHDDVPELLKIVPFFDWDRCKAARRELVDAFVSAQMWSASDFALTVLMCPHTERFLRRTARTYGGGRLLGEIERQLDALPESLRSLAVEGLSDARTWRWSSSR